MSTNKSFWRRWLEGKQDKEAAVDDDVSATASSDSLEEGLQGLSLFDSGKAAMTRLKKRTQSLGEEIGNSITHGVMAIFMLGILPYAAIRAYIRAPEGKEVLDAVGISIFVITVFLMFLSSTIYHSMSHATKHKEVLNRIDHIMIFFAIAGTYTPIALSVIGGGWGLGICIAQWTLVIGGTLFKALAFSKSILSYVFTIAIYLLMGWMVVLCLPILWSTANTVTFWLIIAGGLCYTLGIVSFAMRFKFQHMVWHFIVDLGAICHMLAIVFFMR